MIDVEVNSHTLVFAGRSAALVVIRDITVQKRIEEERRAKEAADDATRKRNYHLALQIIEDLLQKNPLGKQFQDYAKKLKDIDAIATPNQP